MRIKKVLSFLKSYNFRRYIVILLWAIAAGMILKIFFPSLQLIPYFVILYALVMIVSFLLPMSDEVLSLIHVEEEITTVGQAESIADSIFSLEEERLLLWKEIAHCQHKVSVFNDEIEEIRENLSLDARAREKMIDRQEQFRAPYLRKIRVFKIRAEKIEEEKAEKEKEFKKALVADV